MKVQTLILGAGAAGMMCAAHAGRGVLVVDHAAAAGEKIRISGGGRCNFTNLHTAPENFISQNPHFAKSALGRYTQWDFIALVDEYRIGWHEKTLGQLFCDHSAKDIVAMLRSQMQRAGADLWLQTQIGDIGHNGQDFVVRLTHAGRTTDVQARNLVLATGGKSIPKMGATGLAYQVAGQFGLGIIDPRPGLVPLTFGGDLFKPLAGVACAARVAAGPARFDEAILFTHRGLSGPAVLQASSYWHEGDDLRIDLTAGRDLLARLRAHRQTDGKKALATVLAMHLPARLVDFLATSLDISGNMADQGDARLAALCDALADWQLRPSGSEGYRTAEVTLGGVDTADLSSQTLQAKAVQGLFVIGEAVDVTGWLGGYNFQWAWSSGWAAGQAIRARG